MIIYRGQSGTTGQLWYGIKRVIKIEPKIIPASMHKFQRVAAYARVSTTEERQHMSFMAQVDYYKKLIASHPGWIFAGMSALSCRD